MMRNKAFRRQLYFALLLILLAVGTTYFIHKLAALICLFLGVGVTLVYLYYTKKRYEDIYELSHYLRRLMDGEYDINVRDNEEGELGILRNEMFKLTTRLQEQHLFVNEDRQRMAEALADISHQLKTPLTSIQMMVDLLDNDNLPEARREEFLSHTQGQLDRMDWLVKVLLKLSKLDSGTVQFLKNDTKLEGIVNSAIQGVQVVIQDKQLKLNLPEQASPIIKVDEKWMQECVFNVLKNAVDYTPIHGEITISWDDNPILTELTIHNSGSEISHEDALYLFKRFYKGKHASDSSVGIGLSLSLQIMEAHQGTIEVYSEAKKGTSFIFKWYKRK